MRRIIAEIYVDDDKAFAEDMGTIEYLEMEFGWLEQSGITLGDTRILDDDDLEDNIAINLVNDIFGGI